MIEVASHQKKALIEALTHSKGSVTIDQLEEEHGANWITVNVPEDEVAYAVSPRGQLSSD